MAFYKFKGNKYPKRGGKIIVYNPTERKEPALERAAMHLLEAGYQVYTIESMNIDTLPEIPLGKAVEMVREGRVELVATTGYAPDKDYWLRRTSVDFNVPVVLDAWLAEHLAKAIRLYTPDKLKALELKDYYQLKG
jgi:carbamoyl-phosphate synthase large subunit